MPGLVNAHTHLELSYLRGQVPAAESFVTWIRGVVGARRQRPDPNALDILDSVQAGIDESVAAGTALVGDISNTLVSYEPLASSALGGVVFHELLRFNTADADGVVEQACRQIDALPAHAWVKASLAAHAPYSVSPLVFRAIRRVMDARSPVPFSVHLAESRDETEFIATAGGEWRRFLEDVGSWDPTFEAPGVSPVAYLDDIGFLAPRLLAVHGVQMTPGDLARLVAQDATLVTSPRSNQHTGAGVPPVAGFYASGVRVAIGTDSLASTPDLNLFSEMAELRRLAPEVPAARLIRSATIEGAHALGFDASFGTIEVGKRSRLLTVAVPATVTDVEEYLLSGIEPGQLTWVGEPLPGPHA